MERAATGYARRRRDRRGWARRLFGAVIAFLFCVLVVTPPLVSGCGQDRVTSTSAIPASTTSSSLTAGAPPSPVKIGALFPVTGDLAAEGESALKGARLAVEEVNSAGGIASLGGAPLTLLEADSKGDPKAAPAEVARLAQAEGAVAMIGTGQSTVALEATDAAERLELPFLVCSGAADEITERGLAYTFRLCPKADWYARDQVAFLTALNVLAARDVTSVALLHEDSEYGKQTAESQKAYLAEAGIAVVADVEYSPKNADVHDEMVAIKTSGAQALLTATFLGDAALIAEDAAVLRMTIPIVDAAGGVLDPGFAEDAGTAAESMMSVAEYVPGTSPGLTLERQFAGTETLVDADMLYAYQAVWVLADALERAGAVEGPRLRDALATTALAGDHLVLPQDLLTFDGSGQNRRARFLVVQVQDGRLFSVWPREYARATLRLQ